MTALLLLHLPKSAEYYRSRQALSTNLSDSNFSFNPSYYVLASSIPSPIDDQSSSQVDSFHPSLLVECPTAKFEDEEWWSIDNLHQLVPVGAQRPTITMLLRRQPVAPPLQAKATSSLKNPQRPTVAQTPTTQTVPPHRWWNFSASKNLPAGHHPPLLEELPELSRWRRPF